MPAASRDGWSQWGSAVHSAGMRRQIPTHQLFPTTPGVGGTHALVLPELKEIKPERKRTDSRYMWADKGQRRQILQPEPLRRPVPPRSHPPPSGSRGNGVPLSSCQNLLGQVLATLSAQALHDDGVATSF